MIHRIALALAISTAPLSVGQATRVYDNWFVSETSGEKCALLDTMPWRSGQLTLKFIIRSDKGAQHVTINGLESLEGQKIGTLTLSIDGHTIKALHPNVVLDSGVIMADADLPAEIFNAMRAGKTLRYEYRVPREEKPFVQELSLEGFDEAAASCWK